VASGAHLGHDYSYVPEFWPNSFATQFNEANRGPIRSQTMPRPALTTPHYLGEVRLCPGYFATREHACPSRPASHSVAWIRLLRRAT
jgi:hypothetical protein